MRCGWQWTSSRVYRSVQGSWAVPLHHRCAEQAGHDDGCRCECGALSPYGPPPASCECTWAGYSMHHCSAYTGSGWARHRCAQGAGHTEVCRCECGAVAPFGPPRPPAPWAWLSADGLEG